MVKRPELKFATFNLYNLQIPGEPDYEMSVAIEHFSRAVLRDVYYTHIHNDRRESLDHILVSEQFYDYSKKRKWNFKKMHIFNDHLEDDDKTTSDHAPLYAIFVYHSAS